MASAPAAVKLSMISPSEKVSQRENLARISPTDKLLMPYEGALIGNTL
jgi:hypothetical protein